MWQRCGGSVSVTHYLTHLILLSHVFTYFMVQRLRSYSKVSLWTKTQMPSYCDLAHGVCEGLVVAMATTTCSRL